jgi:hypothetical protein
MKHSKITEVDINEYFNMLFPAPIKEDEQLKHSVKPFKIIKQQSTGIIKETKKEIVVRFL